MECDAEFLKLMNDMDYALNQLHSLEFYHVFVDQLELQPEITHHISKLIYASPSDHIPVVVYGIGSIMHCYASRFHLSLALALRDLPNLKIQEIRVCDVNLNLVEKKVLQNLGCALVPSGHRFRLRVDEPTLFFLPFTKDEVFGDLLEMHWCPSALNQIIVIGSSLTCMAATLDKKISMHEGRPKMAIKKLSYVSDRQRFIWAIKEHTRVVNINDGLTKSQAYRLDDLFEGLCWHMFNLDGDVDMEALLPSINSCFKWVDDDTCYPYRMDEEDAKEAIRLQEEMEITIQQVKESDFYHKLCLQLHENPTLQTEFSRRLESEDAVQLVIYALGSLEYNVRSQYQLALAVLLRQDMHMLKIREIQVFDLVITPVDACVMRSLGCTVLTNDECGQRRVEKPTLFFMPCAPFHIVVNMFKANWCPQRLQNVILLGNNLPEFIGLRELDKVYGFVESEMKALTSDKLLRYIAAIENWTIEIPIDKGPHRWSPFRDLNWQFYQLGAEVDPYAFLTNFPILDSIRVDHSFAEPWGDEISWLRGLAEKNYMLPFKCDPKREHRFFFDNDFRGLSRKRSTWSVPPPGWTKLNFDGCSHALEKVCGYGGIIHDEKGQTLISYAGPTVVGADAIAAQVEGLKQGLLCLKKILPSFDNFMVESHALEVTRWATKLVPPPETFANAFNEISNMLESVTCVILHVYSEANTKATRLAKHGATLTELSVWK